MSELIDTVQLQEIDAGIVELFDLTLPSGTSVYLFKGLEDGTDTVYFPNKEGTELNEYLAIPIELEGISMSSSGAANRPTLSVANIPSLTKSLSEVETTVYDIREAENALSEEGIYKNEDLLGTELVYRVTLTTHLKASTDTPSLPVEFPSQKFILDRVSSENNILVQFELASPFDLQGVTLPFRQVNGKYCPWEYQGHHLAGRGGCTWPLDSRGTFYTRENTSISVPTDFNSASYPLPAGSTVSTTEPVVTPNGETQSYTRIWEAVRTVPSTAKDPRKHGAYWKRLDVCGKLISSCKIRFQGASEDTTRELPFGGFPGSKKFK